MNYCDSFVLKNYMNSSSLQRTNRSLSRNHYCNCSNGLQNQRGDPGFPRRGAKLFFKHFPPKLHEIEKIGPREGYASLSPPRSVNENRQYGSGSRRSTTQKLLPQLLYILKFLKLHNGLCPGGSLSRGDLSGGSLSRGVSVRVSA